jgi:hypothetical protein
MISQQLQSGRIKGEDALPLQFSIITPSSYRHLLSLLLIDALRISGSRNLVLKFDGNTANH